MKPFFPFPLACKALCSSLFAWLGLAVLPMLHAQNLSLESQWWTPDGVVNAIVRDGNTVYLGGAFTYVGPPEPYGTAINTTTGTPDLTYLNPNGSVTATLADGSGGWYIGGSFTAVGGQVRNRLARINADGSLHAWNPNANAPISALASDGTRIWAGGSFSTIGGQLCNRLAALDPATGGPLLTASANGTVQALMANAGVVYAGGSFTYVGPNEAYGSATNTTTGTPDFSYLNPNGIVRAALADGSGGWYIGGDFTDVGGQVRNRLARINADGSLHAWNPNASDAVYSLASDGTRIWVGGDFITIGGQSCARLAALDPATGGLLLTAYLNGTASSLVVNAGVVYAGGSFTYAGPDEPFGAGINTTTGSPDFAYLNPNGPVTAVISDGSGGWYIGGSFTQVGGQVRNNLARINADGSLHAWDPNANNMVNALAISGSTVYAGGYFTSIGGQGRSNIAAIDATTGTVTAWNPNAGGTVYALAVDGTTVYVGGDFTLIGVNQATRNKIAALDATTGLATAWNPSANGTVNALVVSGSLVYAGGAFLGIGGYPRSYIAALDASTGLATTWDPYANGAVNALALSGSTLYAGGDFTTIGVTPVVNRSRIAAISTTTGVATAWDPNANGIVYAIVVSGTTVYVGGQFTIIGGQNRNRIAALDATTGLATAWDPNSISWVSALAVSGSTVYAGGYFPSIGGQSRNFIAAVDASTGTVTAWNPNADNVVNALAIGGTTVYAGGNFVTIGGQIRSHIAALEASTGNATGWDPSASNWVYALAISGSTVYAGGTFTTIGVPPNQVTCNRIAAISTSTGLATTGWNADGVVNALVVSGGTVYAGGSFTNIGGQARNYLAALDAAGAATGWNPSTNGVVNALAVSGSVAYAGGGFTSIGGQTRNNIAAVDASTGTLTTWNPNANGPVNALAIGGTTMYAGGSFTNIGGQARNYIAALDASGGSATAWDPTANNAVNALAVSGNTVYAGGNFTTIGVASPVTRNRIAAIDATTGLATTGWSPTADGVVNALVVSGNTVYAGGAFTTINGQPRNRIAAIDALSAAADPWNPNASNTVNALALSGSTLYAGGAFTSVGGLTRNRIAAIDATTGVATAWNPNADGTVSALAVSGTTVYAGGLFVNIGGQARNRIAALDATLNTSNATAWNPNATTGLVSALAVSVSGTVTTVYAGGSFTNIGGQARSRIAALDAAGAAITAWNPNSNSTVSALAVSGGIVYAGGAFTTIGALTRNRIAAIDATTGIATAWNPNAGGTSPAVSALAVSGSTVYAGGTFTTIGALARNRIAAIDATTGIATGWNPNAGSTVSALAVNGNTVYAGGAFTTFIGVLTRNRIAALNSTTGVATGWDANADNTVRALAVSGSTVYAGGNFTTIGGQPRGYFAAFSCPAVITSHPQSAAVCAGIGVTLSLGTTGTGLSYQWQENTGGGFANVASGGTGTSLTISSPTSGYAYRCIATSSDAMCVSTSNSATLTVATAPGAVLASNGAGSGVARTADAECTDGSGWTHYYNTSANEIVLSIKKNGNDIGNIGAGLTVTAYTNSNWSSTAAANITPSSNYVTNGGWNVMNRWWDVTPASQPTTDVQVRSYYTQADLDGLKAATNDNALTRTQLRFYKINDPAVGGPYVVNPASNHSGIPAATGYADPGYWEYTNGASASTTTWVDGTVSGGFYAEYTVRKFSGGGGGGAPGGGGAFPVEFTDINAYWINLGRESLVEWHTASELNTSHFALDRSIDGTAWNEAATTPATGAGSYTLPDAPGTSPVTYYRIRAIDHDGQVTTSSTAELHHDGVTAVAVWPNPARETLHLVAATGTPWAISDLAGRVLLHGSLTSDHARITTAGLPAGVYVVRLGSTQTRVVVE